MARQQKKLKKKELREDPLMTAVTKAQLWLTENGKRLAIVVLVVAAGGVAAILLRNMRASAEQESRKAFADAQLEISQTTPEDVIPPLLGVADNYKGTSGGGEALYTAAEIALNQQQPDRATELFNRYLDEYRGDDLLRAGAYGGLAAALESQAKYAEAADLNYRLANMKQAAHYRYFALLDAGRCYLEAGMEDKAREMYNTIIEEQDVGDYRTRAEEELARIAVEQDSVGLP